MNKININNNKENVYYLSNKIETNYKICNPVNKATKYLIEDNENKELPNINEARLKSSSLNDSNVSIITCTNKSNYFKNIFENYIRQNCEKKELIIILNSSKLNINQWKEKAQPYDNVRVFQLDEKITLGECLNYAIEKSKFEIIAKFDDDDYYGENYLFQAVKALNSTAADVVGKSASYVYFERNKILAIRNAGRENRYVRRVEGPTLVFKRSVFDKVKFKAKNLGEDVQFCKDCCKEKIRIFTTDILNFVYIRHANKSQHSWGISDNYYLKLCEKIGYVNDYISFINK